MNPTKISWCTHTWNPITGCTPVSEACQNCYAKAVHERFYDTPFSQLTWHEPRHFEPLYRKKPSIVFVGSMTDLFHPDVPDHWIYAILDTIEAAHWHTFLILTKRPARMKKIFDSYHADCDTQSLPNLYLGVTAEDQARADERIPILLNTSAAHRFVSIEPMLGEVDLTRLHRKMINGRPAYPSAEDYLFDLDLVIVGGESGSKSKARPMNPEWVRKVYDDCTANNTPFHWKQWGSNKPPDAGSYEFETVRAMP